MTPSDLTSPVRPRLNEEIDITPASSGGVCPRQRQRRLHRLVSFKIYKGPRKQKESSFAFSVVWIGFREQRHFHSLTRRTHCKKSR